VASLQHFEGAISNPILVMWCGRHNLDNCYNAASETVNRRNRLCLPHLANPESEERESVSAAFVSGRDARNGAAPPSME
jgi:hypothetical protein